MARNAAKKSFSTLSGMLAYRMIADRLLREIFDRTPREIDIFQLRDELIQEAKQTLTKEGTSYEEEAAIVGGALSAIDEFFSQIKVNGVRDD